ncbi:MAG: hypothetical protein MR346_09565 [Clostridium sp.]|nr:hypothetical protein [Clostridium sp.]
MESLSKGCLYIVAIIVVAIISYAIGFNVKRDIDYNQNKFISNYNDKLDSIRTEITKRDSIIIEFKNNIKYEKEQAYKDYYNDAINKFRELTSSNRNK